MNFLVILPVYHPYSSSSVLSDRLLVLIAVGMALFASAVIMANTVSLSTMERRRQIGIMKALGLQAENVLGLLLLENGMVGLAGGLLSAGLSIIVVVGSGSLGQSTRSTLYAALWLLVLLGMVLSLAATLITAWGASREKPLNVLRYE